MTDPLRGDPDQTLIYGVDTCEDTLRARARFDAAGRPYRYVNLEHETAVRASLHARGLSSTPVVVTPGGRMEMEPTDATLDELLAETG